MKLYYTGWHRFHTWTSTRLKQLRNRSSQKKKPNKLEKKKKKTRLRGGHQYHTDTTELVSTSLQLRKGKKGESLATTYKLNENITQKSLLFFFFFFSLFFSLFTQCPDAKDQELLKTLCPTQPMPPKTQTKFIIFLLHRRCLTFVPSAGSTALGSTRYLRVISYC